MKARAQIMLKIAFLVTMLVPTAAWATNYGTAEGCSFLAKGPGPVFPTGSPAYFTGTTLAGGGYICQLTQKGGNRYTGKCKDENTAYALDMTISMVVDAIELKFDGDMLPYVLNRCK